MFSSTSSSAVTHEFSKLANVLGQLLEYVLRKQKVRQHLQVAQFIR